MYFVNKEKLVEKAYKPFQRPSFEFSKADFVISLKPDVIAPDAASPPVKDCTFQK